MNDYSLLAQAALGFLIQHMKGPRVIPNWLSYVALGLSSVGLYWWTDHNATALLHADWRQLLAHVVTFFLAARGAAATSKDAKIAPKTDSL